MVAPHMALAKTVTKSYMSGFPQPQQKFAQNCIIGDFMFYVFNCGSLNCYSKSVVRNLGSTIMDPPWFGGSRIHKYQTENMGPKHSRLFHYIHSFTILYPSFLFPYPLSFIPYPLMNTTFTSKDHNYN